MCHDLIILTVAGFLKSPFAAFTSYDETKHDVFSLHINILRKKQYFQSLSRWQCCPRQTTYLLMPFYDHDHDHDHAHTHDCMKTFGA